MSGVSFWSCLGVTWYFNKYRLLLMNEQIVWLHVNCYIIRHDTTEAGQKLVLFQKPCGLSGLFLKQHLTFLAFFAFFFFFFVNFLLKKDQSKSGKICALLIFKIFKLPFSKQIFLWFYRFCPTRWIEDHPVVEQAVSIWKHLTNVVHYWEGLCKSLRPANKSYKTLVKHDEVTILWLHYRNPYTIPYYFPNKQTSGFIYVWWADQNTRPTLTLNISQKCSGRSWYNFEETQN